MRSSLAKIILEMVAAVALGFSLNSCGSQPHCPTCGTTANGAYGILNIVPVPEHNPTGEPGGPFNSFDISWFDPIQQKVYTSDRIGLDVVVLDASNNFAVNTIGGLNQIANAGNNGSPCWGQAATEVQAMPFPVSVPMAFSADSRGRSAAPPALMASTHFRAPMGCKRLRTERHCSSEAAALQ